MFDVGFWEITVIAVIALIVIGPERLPKAARTAGLWVGKARRMVADVKSDIDREIRESELDELKNVGEELNKTKNEFETAGLNRIESNSADSNGESIKDTMESVSPDKSNN